MAKNADFGGFVPQKKRRGGTGREFSVSYLAPPPDNFPQKKDCFPRFPNLLDLSQRSSARSAENQNVFFCLHKGR